MKPKKWLGQNFLKSQKILSFISKRADCPTVLEIGAGDLRLTKFLAKNKSTEKIYAVELDKSLIQSPPNPKIELINNDFLKLKPFPVDCIVGNLPYYISSKILFSLLKWEFKKAILMFQKEFAEKMLASSGDKNYGRLSITSQYYFEIKLLKIIPKELFFPKPKVDSAIVELKKIREEDPIFDKVVRKLYSLRNKKIKNILKNVDLEDYKEKRPRHLSLKEVIEIVETLRNKSKA